MYVPVSTKEYRMKSEYVGVKIFLEFSRTTSVLEGQCFPI
jgi:hypothetical protein